MRASRQTYVGRVIFPAKYIEAKKPFISFVLYLDGHLVSANKKERNSAKISCNYSLPEDPSEDEVAVVLSRIFNKDEDGGGLAGEDYKSVTVLVEGDERLVEVEDKPGAVYKNLDFCRVTILDKDIRALFRKEFNREGGKQGNGNSDGGEQRSSSKGNNVERPTTAPSNNKKNSQKASTRQEEPQQEEAQEEAPKGFKVGQIVEHGGRKYKFLGGDQSKSTSWQLVKDEPQDDVPGFMKDDSGSEDTSAKQASGKTSGRSSLRGFIENKDGGSEDSDMNFSESDNANV